MGEGGLLNFVVKSFVPGSNIPPILYKEPHLKRVAKQVIQKRRQSQLPILLLRPEDILNVSIQSQEALLASQEVLLASHEALEIEKSDANESDVNQRDNVDAMQQPRCAIHHHHFPIQ